MRGWGLGVLSGPNGLIKTVFHRLIQIIFPVFTLKRWVSGKKEERSGMNN